LRAAIEHELAPIGPTIEAQREPGEHAVACSVVHELHRPDDVRERHGFAKRKADQLDAWGAHDLLAYEPETQVIARERLLRAKHPFAFRHVQKSRRSSGDLHDRSVSARLRCGETVV
jgi:hypothetical protein